jgi:hypothetical protein
LDYGIDYYSKKTKGDKIMAHFQELNEEDQKLREQYAKKPPKIVGFAEEAEAVRYIKALGNPDVEDVGDGFVVAKGIVKASNGTFYPAFLLICLQDGGEFYGADFVAENYNEVINQKFVGPYVTGGESGLFPFKYKSLQRLTGDWHQEAWPDFT